MRRGDLSKLCRKLRSLGIDYVLVGGMAVELAGHETGTEDVDLLVSLAEYQGTFEKLAGDRNFRHMEALETIGGGQFFTGDRWIDLDFINPRLFRGKLSAERFVSYVKRYRSRKTAFGRVAAPEVTWYMRLVVPDWEIYVQKILRDIRAGVPDELLGEALAIARHLGVDDVVRQRIEKVKEMAGMMIQSSSQDAGPRA